MSTQSNATYFSRTELSLGGEWHDGYVVYADEGHTRPVLTGLTMEGCLELQKENAPLAEKEPDVFETLAFDESNRTWVLSNEDGVAEVVSPVIVDGVEVWPIGADLGYCWEAREWLDEE